MHYWICITAGYASIVKVLNFLTLENFAVIILKLEKRGFENAMQSTYANKRNA